MTRGYIVATAIVGGFAAAVAQGADTNAAGAAAASPSAALGFSGCRVEVVGVYTQAELRVAVMSGMAGRAAAGAAVPEPDVDRSRGGGASPMASLAPAAQPPAAPAGVADERAGRPAGREAGLFGETGPGASTVRWGWLAESMRQNRERQEAARSRTAAPVSALRADPFSPGAPGLFGGRLQGSPLLPGDTLTPTAPLAPSAYRSDPFDGGIEP